MRYFNRLQEAYVEFNRAGHLKSDPKPLSGIPSTACQEAALRLQREQLGERDDDEDADEEQRRAAAESSSSAQQLNTVWRSARTLIAGRLAPALPASPPQRSRTQSRTRLATRSRSRSRSRERLTLTSLFIMLKLFSCHFESWRFKRTRVLVYNFLCYIMYSVIVSHKYYINYFSIFIEYVLKYTDMVFKFIKNIYMYSRQYKLLILVLSLDFSTNIQ